MNQKLLLFNLEAATRTLGDLMDEVQKDDDIDPSFLCSQIVASIGKLNIAWHSHNMTDVEFDSMSDDDKDAMFNSVPGYHEEMKVQSDISASPIKGK